MANYETLKAAIVAEIKPNGNNEITGELLQNAIIALIESLGAKYQFAGIATPGSSGTNPGTPDYNVMYIAGVGTYPNFGGTDVEKGHIGVFVYNGSWDYETIETGAYFEFEEYPDGAAVEFTFYDSENPDGVSFKINKDVSGISNAPDEAISQWWAAQMKWKLQDVQGYTDTFPSLSSSVQSLGLFGVIKTGKVIDSITGANKLIFIAEDTTEYVVTPSDLPYKALADLVSVKLESGTASNVSIHVRGEMDMLISHININEIANHPDAYANAATALGDVPTLYRRKGMKVVYFDDTQQTWIEMLNIDDAGANWWTDVTNNWVIDGPIETEIPTNTGGQQLRVGGTKRGNLDDVLNVNVWNNQATEYATQAAARAAVPANKRKLGAIITYLVSTGTDTSGWMIDEFIGSSISDWTVTDNWKTIGPVSVTQNTETGKKEMHIGAEVAFVVDNEPTGDSQNLITSGAVKKYGMSINEFVLPLVDGGITKLLHIVRGLASINQSDINYSPTITTRLVSDKMAIDSATYITITNNSTSPKLKIMVVRKVQSTGLIAQVKAWTTESIFGFFLDATDTEWYAINIAKNDDSAIIPSDIDGLINVVCSGGPKDYVLYSSTTPNVNPSSHILDLGASPIIQVRPNNIISLDSVSSSEIYRNISLINPDSRYSIVTFNTRDYTFSAKKRSERLSNDEIILGVYDSENPKSCWFRFYFTFNGIDLRNLNDSIGSNNSIPINKAVFDEFVKESIGFSLVGNVTQLLNFKNGNTLAGRTDIVYNIATRLISYPISANPSSKIDINNTNNNLYFMVFAMSRETGEYYVVESWRNGNYSFVTNINNDSHYLIGVRKTDDSNITVSDLTGITVWVDSLSSSDEINQANRIYLYSYDKRNGYINTGTGKWTDVSSSARQHICIPIPTGKDKVFVELGQDNITYETINILLLGSYNVTEGESANILMSVYYSSFKNNRCVIDVPNGANYIYIQATSGARDYLPRTMVIFESTEEKGIMKYYPKDETIPLLANLTRRYFTYGGSATEFPPVLSLIHCSDVHANNENILRIADFFKNYSSYIQNVIDTGDFIGGSFRDGLPTSISDAVVAGFIRAIGNHDTMNREGTPPDHQWVLVNQKDCYDQNLKDYIGNWGVVQPTDAATDGCCYYYKDYTSNGVRLIVLDCEHWSNDQNTWLQNVLEDARTQTTPLHVLIAVHRAPFAITKDDDNPFSSIDYTNAALGNYSDAAISVKNFIDAGGIFITWLSGHVHDDYFGVGTSANYSNQLVIGVGTAGIAPATPYSSMAKNEGCRNQDCFNIVGIDTHLKILKLLRIGANYDRYMRRKNTLCWDYNNNQIIFID